MSKILLTGSSGILGNTILSKLSDNYIFLSLKNQNEINQKYNQIKTKKLNFKYLRKIIIGFKPDTIIHAAANTNIEDCQSNKKKCKKVNFELTRNLVKISKLHNIKFIFISTDQVYNRKLHQNENDKIKSFNYYTETKILSENFIKSNLKNYAILRTNFFGRSIALKKSFSDFIISSLKNLKKIFLFDDVYFNPINIDNLTRIIEIIINNQINGVFNIGVTQGLSKYQFGIKIAKKLNLNPNLIIKDNFLNRKDLSNRPLDMRMDVSKIKKIVKHNKLFNLNYNLSLLVK